MLAEFAAWVTTVVEHHQSLGWSKTKIAEAAGMHRNTLDKWLQGRYWPSAAALKRFCAGLGQPYEVPARILGWTRKPVAESLDDAVGKLRRAKLILEGGSLPEAERAKYEARRQALEVMIDGYLEELERAQRDA